MLAVRLRYVSALAANVTTRQCFFEPLYTRACHVGIREPELLELGKPLEVLEAFVCHVGIREPELLELSKPFEMLKANVCHFGVGDVQRFELCQPFDIRVLRPLLWCRW